MEMEMEKNASMKQKQLPIGFRFRPTDEELVIHYLRRKVLSLPLPASIVPDHVDVFRTHPSHLPGDWREKRYFFSKRRNIYRSGMKIKRSSSGYWKVIGKSKAIPISPGTVGLKTCLLFYQRKKTTPSPWIMHEFRLLGTRECTSVVGMGDWVVCCIYQKKEKKDNKKRYRDSISKHINFSSVEKVYMKIEPLLATNVITEPQDCDCSSSGITQVDLDVDDDGDDVQACSAARLHLEI